MIDSKLHRGSNLLNNEELILGFKKYALSFCKQLPEVLSGVHSPFGMQCKPVVDTHYCMKAFHIYYLCDRPLENSASDKQDMLAEKKNFCTCVPCVHITDVVVPGK